MTLKRPTTMAEARDLVQRKSLQELAEYVDTPRRLQVLLEVLAYRGEGALQRAVDAALARPRRPGRPPVAAARVGDDVVVIMRSDAAARVLFQNQGDSIE